MKNLFLIATLVAAGTVCSAAGTATHSPFKPRPAPTPAYNPDLVVPSADPGVDQDAISAEKQKRAAEEIDQDAIDAEKQKRAKEYEQDAVKPGQFADENDKSYTTLIPYFGGKAPPKLQKRLRNGTYIYKVKRSEQTHAAGFRAGPYNPTNLMGDLGTTSYSDIYGKSGTVLLDFNYEWQFFQSAGKLGVKTDLGLFFAKGQGRFRNSPTTQADETVSLVGFPLGLSGIYHAQFWDRQVIVPFGEVGGDYIPFAELRGDKTIKQLNEMIRYGGAPAWHWAAGLQLQLDFLDKEGLWQLDSEYGINHIYFTVDARQINGLSNTFDFSAMVFEGGFLFEY